MKNQEITKKPIYFTLNINCQLNSGGDREKVRETPESPGFIICLIRKSFPWLLRYFRVDQSRKPALLLSPIASTANMTKMT